MASRNYEYLSTALNDAKQRVFELENEIDYLKQWQLRAERQIKDLEVLVDGLMKNKERSRRNDCKRSN